MMYHLFHNSMWKVVRIAKTSDCKTLLILKWPPLYSADKFEIENVLSVLGKQKFFLEINRDHLDQQCCPDGNPRLDPPP